MSNSDLLKLNRCNTCSSWWSLRPYACASCGSTDLVWDHASGVGVVRAVSTVHRAPDTRWREHAPYTLVLVRLAEGPTVMAHAAADIQIGDTVSGQEVSIAERTLLKFIRTAQP